MSTDTDVSLTNPGPGYHAFKPVHEKIFDLIEAITDNFGSDDAFSARVEGIEHRSRDGFMAFTDGGWRGIVSNGIYPGSGSVPRLIQKYVDADQKYCEDSFREEHDMSEGEEPDYDSQVWQDHAANWEMAEQDEWFVYIKAYYYRPGNHRNGGDESNVYFAVSINDDFGYGRESISWISSEVDHIIWSETVAVTDLTDEKLEELKQAAIAAYASSFGPGITTETTTEGAPS